METRGNFGHGTGREEVDKLNQLETETRHESNLNKVPLLTTTHTYTHTVKDRNNERKENKLFYILK